MKDEDRYEENLKLLAGVQDLTQALLDATTDAKKHAALYAQLGKGFKGLEAALKMDAAAMRRMEAVTNELKKRGIIAKTQQDKVRESKKDYDELMSMVNHLAKVGTIFSKDIDKLIKESKASAEAKNLVRQEVSQKRYEATKERDAEDRKLSPAGQILEKVEMRNKIQAEVTKVADEFGLFSAEMDKYIKGLKDVHEREIAHQDVYIRQQTQLRKNAEEAEKASQKAQSSKSGWGNLDIIRTMFKLKADIGHQSDTMENIAQNGFFEEGGRFSGATRLYGKAKEKVGGWLHNPEMKKSGANLAKGNMGLSSAGMAGLVIILKQAVQDTAKVIGAALSAPLKVFQGMKSLKGLEDIDNLFKEITGVMTATIEAVVNTISSMMDSFAKGIEAGINGLTNIITALLNVVTTIMNLIIDSSPMLQGMLKLFMKLVNLILMPIGNIIAMILLPILRNNVRGIMELVKSGNKLLNEIMNGDFSGLTDFLQKVGSTLGNMLGQIFTTLSPVISQIFTDVFPSLMNSLTMPGKDAKGNATDSPLQVFVKNVIKVITDQGVIDAIGKAAWQGITTALRELFNYLLGQIPNPFSSVKGSLDGIINPFNSIKTTIDSITNPFANILSSIGSITDPFSSLKLSLDGITNPLDSIGSSITNFFGADGVGGITNPLSGMLSWFTDFFGDKGLKQITNPFEGILSWFTDFFGGTDSIGKNAEGTKTNPLSGVLGFITDFFEPFKTMTDPFTSVTGFFNDFKDGFNITDPFKSVGDFFSTFKNLFSGITDDPFKIFTDFFNTFKGIFTGIVNDPFKIFTDFFNTFKGVFDKIVNDPFKIVTDFFNTFKNIFNISDPFATIRGYFNTFFGFLTGKDVKNPFQIILDIIGGAFNGVISLANQIIALNPMNWIGGTKIGNIAIPQLADGGIVTSATQAIIGEAGPEAVIPLDKMGSMGFGNAKVTININGNIYGVDDLENAIRSALSQYQMEQQYR